MLYRRNWWLILIPAALFMMGCTFPFLASLTGSTHTDGNGVLDVNINYTGSWYVDTFGYARDAENVRHFVLVIPADLAQDVNPGAVFTSIALLPDGIGVREGREDYAWALDYVHEVPEGYLTATFEPGTYAVAAAFITGPLSREEANAGDDAILWAGITGGGASTDFETVTLAAGETESVTFLLTDDDGWACPWLYVWNGEGYERRTEILRNVRSAALEQTEVTAIGSVSAVNGEIVIRIAEEKDEVTYLDALTLQIGDTVLAAESGAETTALLAGIDGQYLVLHEGESVELRFRAPEGFVDGANATVIATGYYIPGG